MPPCVLARSYWPGFMGSRKEMQYAHRQGSFKGRKKNGERLRNKCGQEARESSHLGSSTPQQVLHLMAPASWDAAMHAAPTPGWGEEPQGWTVPSIFFIHCCSMGGVAPGTLRKWAGWEGSWLPPCTPPIDPEVQSTLMPVGTLPSHFLPADTILYKLKSLEFRKARTSKLKAKPIHPGAGPGRGMQQVQEGFSLSVLCLMGRAEISPNLASCPLTFYFEHITQDTFSLPKSLFKPLLQ